MTIPKPGAPKAPSGFSREAASLGHLMFAAKKVGLERVAAAFKKLTFIYGTAGSGNQVLLNALHRFNGDFSRPVSKFAPPGKVPDRLPGKVGRVLNLFAPGVRVKALHDKGHQMMDMYYGQAGNNLFSQRDPAIAAFVHYAMGFDGEFTMKESGRDAYMRTFKTKVEGWNSWDPVIPTYNLSEGGKKSALTTTQEMSRIIRWGIQRFGGTLIFEGREVYYGAVFEATSTDTRDTVLEARSLFEYFKPGMSTVPFGSGQLVFHWDGIETVPTQLHFRSNWAWANGPTHTIKNASPAIDPQAMRPIWKNFSESPKNFGGTEPKQLYAALDVLKRMKPGNLKDPIGAV